MMNDQITNRLFNTLNDLERAVSEIASFKRDYKRKITELTLANNTLRNELKILQNANQVLVEQISSLSPNNDAVTEKLYEPSEEASSKEVDLSITQLKKLLARKKQ